MSNTRRTVTLDLSGLQADSTTIGYSSFSAPALNGLLYNEGPVHSGGGVGSLFSTISNAASKAVGPAAKGLFNSTKGSIGLVAKEVSSNIKNIASTTVRDIAETGARDMLSSNRLPSPNRSSNRPPSPNRSSNRPPSPNRSSNRPPSPNRSSNRPPSPKDYSATSSTMPSMPSMNSNNSQVNKLRQQLAELGIQEEKINKKKQEVLELLKRV